MTEITTDTKIDDGIKMLEDVLLHFNELSKDTDNHFATEIARMIMGILAVIDVIQRAYRMINK